MLHARRNGCCWIGLLGKPTSIGPTATTKILTRFLLAIDREVENISRKAQLVLNDYMFLLKLFVLPLRGFRSFSSPELPAKKTNGMWRFSVLGAPLFPQLDLYLGYHQIQMHPNHIEKTAFRISSMLSF